jgi:hypothetical protein
VLSADGVRSALLAEEELLLQDFEEQGKFYSSDEVDIPSGEPWNEEQWAAKLERYCQVGVELEANGAEAAEAKVYLHFYSVFFLYPPLLCY